MIEELNNFSTYLDEELKKSEAIGEKKGLAKGLAEGEAIGEKKGLAKGLAKGEAIGEARGRSEGRTEEKQNIIKMLYENGLSESDLAQFFKLSTVEIQKILSSSN